MPDNEKPPIVLGPVIEELSKFHPIGWYSTIRKRKHWWSIRKSTIPIGGIFKSNKE